jgi:flavodoxin
MKTLITYASLTGNTKKIALAVKDAIPNADLLEITQITQLDYDCIIVGTWIDKGSADPQATTFIQKLENKKVAFFFTLGAYPDSDHAQNCDKAIRQLFLENGNTVLGSFWCQGAVDPNLIEKMKTMFPLDHPHGPNPERIKRWKDASTHPDEADQAAATEYFKNLFKQTE